MQEMAEVLEGYGGILQRKGPGSWAVFRECYLGWYSEVMNKEDAIGGIYRACGLLIIRLLCTNIVNICKAVADRMAVLFICRLDFFFT